MRVSGERRSRRRGLRCRRCWRIWRVRRGADTDGDGMRPSPVAASAASRVRLQPGGTLYVSSACGMPCWQRRAQLDAHRHELQATGTRLDRGDVFELPLPAHSLPCTRTEILLGAHRVRGLHVHASVAQRKTTQRRAQAGGPARKYAAPCWLRGRAPEPTLNGLGKREGVGGGQVAQHALDGACLHCAQSSRPMLALNRPCNVASSHATLASLSVPAAARFGSAAVLSLDANMRLQNSNTTGTTTSHPACPTPG